ncbi:nitrate/nitrite transporter NarK [Pseudomonas sp. URIL14HWK12:I3]|uniref:OFA family MFS transporter n=1 Tax=Pseudomonas TaxID=286 RepID=UPI0006724A2C|nr:MULTISPECIES: OFA family MFS transporter [Pseudomonas]AVF53842.1 MFS transporter [Pseudomonas fulva]MBA1206906.1 OFA family MFS transporter [Pseudomonas fulva]MDH0571271.1 OFA family MFS transporter [Pseudomonas fulva]PZW56282.1 nitrate/nitrite transporter NarK [Pseudomonas sp. URIL14HWK12:I3]PZW58036.1 nitrate/nitrite transporter NarK [Pseudomonas sp. URIL14HWK12:I2]
MSRTMTADALASAPGFLSKERIIARPGFNRWLVPPAALAIHLCIGMAYGFSVFWLPLSQALGITAPVACAPDMSFVARLFSAECDWPISMLSWIYTLFFVFLGCSAAVLGGWLEHAGPRKAGLVSALCWCGGMLISAIGVKTHQLWLMWLGSGVIGGIGLGLGYISPVSTLIKWFPDKRGMATGMAIMGFGGGAMVGAPLATALMGHFGSAQEVGVWQSFVVMAAIYFVFMTAGALAYRIPPTGWKPEGWTAPAKKAGNGMVTDRHVHVSVAWKTPQFVLVWLVLCLNVSAGIGILGMASPLLQEVFAGKLLGNELTFSQLNAAQLAQIAAIAAGFTGLLSLFNIGGRFFWASFSDYIGRKNTYFAFFALGVGLYSLIPNMGHLGNVALFVAAFCIILSMYGGGFSTVPAYLADLFGTQMVGAIHGRLLTAWAAAGVLGPVLITYLRESQLAAGVERAAAYDMTLYILAGLLVLGFICNVLIRPVADKYFMSDAQLAAERALSHDKGADGARSLEWKAAPGSLPLVLLAWAVVVVPLAWGVWVTLQKTAVLFH